VGIYLSTHNGGFATRVAIELLAAVEKVTGRGKAILVVHDISRSIGGDLSIKAYRMSEGAREATRRGKWDSLTLNENKVTAATLLSTLPVTVSSPSLLNALLSTLTTPAESSSSKSFSSTLESNVILPPTFAPLQNPTDTSLPAYLSSTLDSLLLHNHETNNVAFLQRQIAREKTKHDSLVREREEENVRRKKAGMGELPLIGEFKGAAKDPNRLELVCLTGQVDSLAKNMGAEAAKGLVRAYL
jgi:translation initiation factor 3 subunit H